MWKVYIMKCSDDTLYTGITTDLDRRLCEHNWEWLWAKYTKIRQPVELVYSIDSKNRSEASKEESRIKKLTKKQKLKMIENINRPRCSWVWKNNPLMIEYHDNDWGVETHNDKIFFEFLVLEWAQAWLSWDTILKRRISYKKAFDNYDLNKIIKYSDKKKVKLMNNEWIIRNRLKIKSVIKNAEVFLSIQKEFWSFDKYIWSYVDWKQINNSFNHYNEMPATTELSDKVSKDLKKRWMSFVGSTIIYAFLEAVWIVDDHEIWCFKYKQ